MQPGKSLKHTYTMFAGPKRPELLAAYDLGNLIYYGWFGWVAEPMTRTLRFFYAVVSNYGLAIIFLTVLVRLCMFPQSRKQAFERAEDAVAPAGDQADSGEVQERHGRAERRPSRSCSANTTTTRWAAASYCSSNCRSSSAFTGHCRSTSNCATHRCSRRQFAGARIWPPRTCSTTGARSCRTGSTAVWACSDSAPTSICCRC